jgi:hypothetical protein
MYAIVMKVVQPARISVRPVGVEPGEFEILFQALAQGHGLPL